MKLSSMYPRLLPYAQKRARVGVVVNCADTFLAGRRNVSTVRTSAEATATAIADADAAAKLLKSTATLHLPKPIFPWRSETELLPRIIPGTPEYAKDIRVAPSFRSITAFYLQETPTKKILPIPPAWRLRRLSLAWCRTCIKSHSPTLPWTTK
jgi:hypothetical protein